MSEEIEEGEGAPRLPPLEPLVKRVILRDRSGLHRIVGTLVGTPPDIIAQDPSAPVFSLLKVTTRYLLYQETQPQEAGRFNEFHPSQV